jgi:ribonuclease-3
VEPVGGTGAETASDRAGLSPHERLAAALGHEVPTELLQLAVTHRSYAYENGGLPTNERLEFLGDAVLEMVVTDHLYRAYPELSEGDLAKIRAHVVNATTCAAVADELGAAAHLLLGKGEESTGGRRRSSILADLTEALIGAVYLGCGLAAATELVERLFLPRVVQASSLGAGLDWKTSLQEFTAQHGLGVPQYVVEGQGPDHDRRFTAVVQVGDGRRYGRGAGRTKKAAEKLAAESAFQELQAEVARQAGQPPGPPPAPSPARRARRSRA